MLAPAHLLAGQYAHAVEEWDYAAAHFQAVQQLANHAPTQLLASSFLALTLCCKPGSSAEDVEGAQAAVDALGDTYVELTSSPVGSRGAKGSEPLELVMAQIATALIKYRMGQHQEAHRRLSLALRAAHGRLVHHSLVSTCMTYLVPLLLQMGDLAAADSVVASAHLLARGSMRTTCQLHRLLEAVSLAMPRMDRAAKARADHEREAAQLQAQKAEACTSDAPGHAYVLNFGLGS
ncbi:hypothetical protein DUNSADRAFT_17360 [Dunaliella salina]|uniref:Uncharacterized protein n=1 Tax=Dunaliella salina TaxID=3046 RepID=A0ABQ7H090_DUNSA|nr:hypothetical protein DUNSADRAFT_17360 [Dunaliella salina]|eukprot:KAF5840257.1 hypothetical protein DUNSADRAFT_17360 [Dunaliella salina]